jgi:predicted O-methyltransferase YrrM
MESILKEYSDRKEYYKSLQSEIAKTVAGRCCHHKVLILHLLTKLNPIQTYVEIGVHNGTSMSYVLRNAPRPLHCIGIDLFEGTIQRYKKDSLRLERTRKSLEASNTAGSQVTLIQGNSTRPETVAAAKEALGPAAKADLVFIDGDHEYKGVKADIERYAPLVKPDGFLVFDDVEPTYPGVVKATEELLKSPEWQILGLWESSVLVVQKKSAPRLDGV